MKEYKRPKMEIDYFEDNLGLLFTESGIGCMGYHGGTLVDPFECESSMGSYDYNTGICTSYSAG
ncbi:MAG: hypothetical protein J1E56_04205 [Ruminococcus sp.]|nr:hypothetical protein [Ruminococcus sp.]